MKLRILLLLGAAALSCLPPAETGRQDRDAIVFSGSVFITGSRLETIRTRLADRAEPTQSAFPQVLEAAGQSLGRPVSPPVRWYVPAFYRDKEGHQKVPDYG